MSTSSRYFNLQPSYSIDLNEDRQHQQQLHDHQILLHHHNFESLLPYSSSSSLPLSSPFSPSSPIYSNPDQIGYLYMGSQFQPSSYHQEVDNNFGPIESESCDQTTLEINKGANPTSLKFNICKKEDQIFGGEKDGGGAEINGPSVKWMPLRLMKKMMRGQDQNKQLPPVQVEAENQHLMSNKSIDKSLNNSSSSISSNNNKNDNNITTIRVCSDCNTTKTPLWRSGPRGPKSLCNACGIRQRKARRAMAMAINGPVPPNSMSGSIPRVGNGHKKASNNNNGFGAQKKRSKVAKPSRDHYHINDAQRKLCFEEFVLKLSKKFSLHQVFPQEEKEAAILLMALSCGFLHG